MPKPSRRPSWNQFLRHAQGALGVLDSPGYKAEALQEDLDPRSMQQLEEALQDPRHKGPMQQRVLMDEKERLKGVQAQMVAQRAQSFPQRLGQRINLQARTGEPPLTQSPESFMAKLMLMMQRRHGVGPTAQGDTGF